MERTNESKINPRWIKSSIYNEWMLAVDNKGSIPRSLVAIMRYKETSIGLHRDAPTYDSTEHY
jgi:hypothetical protein